MTKTCSSCKATLDISQFNRCVRNSDGFQYSCKECSRLTTLACRQKRLERDPEADRRTKKIWYQKNREISLERARQYRLNHPEWAKEMDVKHHKEYNWRTKYPEKAKILSSEQAFKRKIKKYNLSPEEFQAMHERQEGKCAVCQAVPADGLVIDHNHTTNKVRELLCNRCNPAVGMIGENPDIARKIITYLEKHS